MGKEISKGKEKINKKGKRKGVEKTFLEGWMKKKHAKRKEI